MKFFLFFITIPILEIILFIKITDIVGLMWTVIIIIATAIIGSLAVRQQGMHLILALQNREHNTAFILSNGALILVAGLLLITTGLITDSIGFALLVPKFRAMIIRQLQKKISSSYQVKDIYDLWLEIKIGVRHEKRGSPVEIVWRQNY